MIPAALLQEEVVVEDWQPGPRNARGERPQVKAGETPYPAHVEQLATREETTGRIVVVDAWLLVLPPDAKVDASSLVRWGDGRYKVDGTPLRPSVLGRPSHVEAKLRRVAGVA